MSAIRKSSFAALAFLLVASAAQAVSYTVTLANGTSFETRYRPMTAEWDTNIAMLRTDQGNWIALKKSEIVDVASAAEIAGFGYQIDETTVFLGWSATEGLVADDGTGTAPAGTTAAAGAPAGGGSSSAAAAPAGQFTPPEGSGGFSMQQFVSVPSSGVVPGGVPLGGSGTESGGASQGGGGGS